MSDISGDLPKIPKERVAYRTRNKAGKSTNSGALSKKDEKAIAFIRAEWSREDLEKQYAICATTLPDNWQEAQKRIFRQDRKRCVVCGANSWIKKLLVHHRDGNEQNNKPSNLITVCHDCHAKFPVPPFSENFYCKTIIHRWYDPVCLRLGKKIKITDPRNCPFYSRVHGCLFCALQLRNH